MKEKFEAVRPFASVAAALTIIVACITVINFASANAKERVNELIRRVDKLESIIDRQTQVLGDIQSIRTSIEEINKRLDRERR